MARNRVIYQSEALFVSDGTLIPTATHPSGNIKQLHRVQSANYGFSVARQDINQFGNLARIDAIILEPPTVTMDFTYYLHTGNNETALGFSVGTGLGTTRSFISGLIDASQTGDTSTLSGRNFHIFTAPEGNDANGVTPTADTFTGVSASTITIGNGFITNYSVEASVGNLPTVSVSVEGLNINVVEGSSGVLPSLTVETSATGDNKFQLPAPNSGSIGISALRPGDITLELADPVLADFPTGADSGNTAAHIQSFSIEIPVGRTTLQRLGSRFGFAKVIDFPIEVTVNVSAILADLKQSGNLDFLVSNDEFKTLKFTFKDPAGNNKIIYQVKGAKLVSENHSSTIGDNKTVDLVFTTQIGAPQDTTNGVFVATTD
jgi:hypothetical protein